MKLMHTAASVERGETQESWDFSVRVDGKLFDLYTSKLYSNKFSSILRELGANAVDSHVDAGKQIEPFLVQLPCAAEPTLKVRDYGVGLSHEQMRHVYSVLGASDKCDSNQYIGALGLGAKSPFAYTDSFTVRTWHGGQVRQYVIYRKEDRTIGGDLVSVANEEGCGTEVTFAVKSSDFYSFSKAAPEAYRFFKVKPKITGAQVTFPEENYKIITNRYGLAHARGKSFAVMGNVGYPIEANSIVIKEGEDFIWKLIDYGIHLFLPIGAVDIAPSREALSYDPQTIARLRHELKHVCADVESSFTTELNKAPDLWEARCKYGELAPHFELFLGKGHKLKWRGQEICNTIHFGGTEFPFGNAWMLNIERYGYSSKTAYRKRESDKLTISDRLNLVVINDIPVGVFAGTFREIDARGYNNAVILPAEAANYIDKIGRPPVLLKASELPKAAILRDATGKVVRKKQHARLRSWDAGSQEFQNEKDVDIEDGGLYVETYGREYRWPNATNQEVWVSFNALNAVWGQAKTLLLKDTTLYSIRTSDLERMKKAGPWVDLRTKLTALLEKLTPELLEPAQLRAADDRLLRLGHHTLINRQFVNGSSYKPYAELAKRAAAARASARVQAFASLAANLGAPEIKPHEAFGALQIAVYEAYPLLFELYVNQSHTLRKEGVGYYDKKSILASLTDKQFQDAAYDYITLLDERRAQATPRKARAASA